MARGRFTTAISATSAGRGRIYQPMICARGEAHLRKKRGGWRTPYLPDVARWRTQCRKYHDRIDPERLVFIDETWTRTDVPSLRGYCVAAGSQPTFHAPGELVIVSASGRC